MSKQFVVAVFMSFLSVTSAAAQGFGFAGTSASTSTQGYDFVGAGSSASTQGFGFAGTSASASDSESFAYGQAGTYSGSGNTSRRVNDTDFVSYWNRGDSHYSDSQRFFQMRMIQTISYLLALNMLRR